MAIVHVAMFDAVNAIDRSYEPYFADVHASSGASKEAAAAQAAHDTLSALYPSRQAIYDAALADDLTGIPPGLARQGIAIGHEVAQQILALRANDGSSAIVGYTPPNTNAGQWQPTARLQSRRQRTRPTDHAIRSGEQLPVPPRPAARPG